MIGLALSTIPSPHDIDCTSTEVRLVCCLLRHGQIHVHLNLSASIFVVFMPFQVNKPTTCGRQTNG